MSCAHSEEIEHSSELHPRSDADSLRNRRRCAVEGFIPPQRIRDIFATADFVLGKPGPGVVAEAIVCGLGYVTENRAPLAQEACVIDYLRSTGVGVLVSSLLDLPKNLLERCAVARDKARLIQNRAVFEVADHLQAIIQPGISAP